MKRSTILYSTAMIIRLFAGYFLCSIGTVMMINSDLGLNPWGIFFKGLSMHTGLTFGQISQLSGFIILIFSMFLSILPGLGTVLNMFFFGLFVDMVSETKLIPMPGNFTNRFIMLMIAMIIYCTGIYLYLSCRLGAGPKDGLMLGFSKKLNLTISHTRIIIESFVLIVGFFLGGPLGIGTVVLAILTGPILQKIFRFAKIDPKKERHMDLKQLISRIGMKNNFDE